MENKKNKKTRVKTWVLYAILIIQVILLINVFTNLKAFAGSIFVLYILIITITFTLNKIIKRL